MALKIKTSMALSRPLLDRLDDLALAKGQSRSDLIEGFIERCLGDEELGVRVVGNPVLGPALLQMLARPEIMRAMSGALRETVSDDQLQLFSQAMTAAGTVVASKSKPAVPAKKRKRVKK